MKRTGFLVVILALLLGYGASAWALSPDELLLLTNSTNPAGERCAKFYAKARLVPDGRILSIKMPNNDQISFEQYERDVVPAVRAFIRRNHLETKIKCIVTFYGVPLRIGGHKPTPAEKQEMGQIRQLTDQTVQKADSVVDEAEAFAGQLNPQFVPVAGSGANKLAERATKALGTIAVALHGSSKDPGFKKNVQRFIQLTSTLSGDAEVLRQFPDQELKNVAPTPADGEHWATRRVQIQAALGELQTLQEQRYDPEARKRLRGIVPEDFGLFGTIALLNSQLEYLNNDGSAAAFDNELACLWWDYYPRNAWIANPLNYHFHGRQIRPIVMTMRLDAPQEAEVYNIILSSLRAEKEGLHGRVAIDSTGGLDVNGGVDKRGGYHAFDEHLQHLATLVRADTNMPLTLDEKATLFPPNSVKDCALYCGWYSVRNYIPFASFTPGAVAYHIASYEMVSLHMEGEKGWCAGLLNDGVAATLGAVAEPYLAAFPLPDEFFPMLMTGRCDLADAYWSTLPQVSWMMSCVGDPLYTPFAKDPQLKVSELPEQLQVLFAKPGDASSKPEVSDRVPVMPKRAGAPAQ